MGTVRGLGTREAAFTEDDDGDPGYRSLLAGEVRDLGVHPVYFGSAVTGAGVDALTRGLADLMPAASADAAGPVDGRVFKVERGAAGEKIAYARLFRGTITVRDRVPFGDGKAGKVTAISVFADGGAPRREAVTAGEIARLAGLAEVKVGDVLGTARGAQDQRYFAPPTLETAVVAGDPGGKARLHAALAQLAEQDPLINVRQDDVRQEIYLSLYGEVQKQVIEATLASEYGLAAAFSGTTPICVERPVRSGRAQEILQAPGNPFLATLGIRIDPAPAGSGLRFRVQVGHEGVPLYIYKNLAGFAAAMEQHVTGALRQGLQGWQVTDATVSLVRSGYSVPDGPPATRGPLSGPQDFRKLTPLVVMAALQRAGTQVCEPVHRFRLECPADTLAVLLPVLAGLRAVPGVTATQGPVVTLEGDIPAARVHALRQQIPPLTRGEGVLESSFDRYEPHPGPAPARPRTDDNPLDREEYIRRVTRRGAREIARRVT
jgi:ribosomal protection tetracycline resistance protein